METSDEPRLVRDGGGRRIAFDEVGASEGFPIISQHGAPGSRLMRDPNPDVYRRVRFITVDRPGYGQTDPTPGRDVASAVADVQTVADALEVERFGVMGLSAGGPYALAAAALLPQRVAAVALMASVAPMDGDFDYFAGMSEPNIEGTKVAMRGRDADWIEMEPIVRAIQSDPYGFFDQVSELMPVPDRPESRRRELRDMMARSFLEGARQDGEGWLEDDAAAVRPWGFSLSGVRSPVRIWHAEADPLVPLGHAQYLARALPNATLSVVPGADHGAFDYFREACDWVASKS